MRPSLPIILLLTALIAGCNLLYKQDIPQGTLLSAEMLAALKPGMTRRQVRLLLGSPPVVDTFHPERWDYVYSVSKAVNPVRNVSLCISATTRWYAPKAISRRPCSPNRPTAMVPTRHVEAGTR
jgi:outer membrane protein assembly factor BamE (lipoprotein component of BamABCDE complex)